MEMSFRNIGVRKSHPSPYEKKRGGMEISLNEDKNIRGLVSFN